MHFLYSRYIHSRNEREREASRFGETFELKSWPGTLTFHLVIASTHLSENVISFRMVDCPLRKPNCLVDNRLCLFKCLRIVYLTAASIILKVIEVRETGR